MNDAEYVALMGTPPPAPVQPEPPTSAAFRLAARGPTDAVDSMTMAFQALDSAARELEALLVEEEERIERATRTSRGLFGR